METYQVFTRILKSLGCYGEYVNNFTKFTRYHDFYSKTLSFRLFVNELEKFHGKNINSFEYFINDSFDWSRTEQGHNYWSGKNSEFKKIYKEYLGYLDYESSLDEETKNIVFNFLNTYGK